MSSIYDELETVEELIQEVKMNGFRNTESDICRAQDIIGRTKEYDLGKLMEKGDTRDTLFMILMKTLSYEQVCCYYNRYVLKLNDKISAMEKENSKYQHELKSADKEYGELKTKLMEFEKKNEGFQKELAQKDLKIQEREMEIMKLKAKLYDMITKEEA